MDLSWNSFANVIMPQGFCKGKSLAASANPTVVLWASLLWSSMHCRFRQVAVVLRCWGLIPAAWWWMLKRSNVHWVYVEEHHWWKFISSPPPRCAYIHSIISALRIKNLICHFGQSWQHKTVHLMVHSGICIPKMLPSWTNLQLTGATCSFDHMKVLEAKLQYHGRVVAAQVLKEVIGNTCAVYHLLCVVKACRVCLYKCLLLRMSLVHRFFLNMFIFVQLSNI